MYPSRVAKNLGSRQLGPAGQLGALGDDAPTGGSSIYDGSRDAFLAWVNAVKRAGGTAATYPYHQTLNPLAWWDLISTHDAYGCPAARYPSSVAASFDNEPDQIASTATGEYAWYLAPSNVIRWARSPNGMDSLRQMAQAGTDVSKLPDDAWYTNLKTALKFAAIGGVALIALQLVQFVPKPKDWE